VKAAIYARVSTLDQEPENQLLELRRYVEARGWTAVEYVDKGVSGAKDRARAQGRRLGRPRALVPIERVRKVNGLSVDAAALSLGVSRSTLKRWRRQMAESGRGDQTTAVVEG